MSANPALRIAQPEATGDQAETPMPHAPLLIDARELGRLLSLSLATIRRMHSAAKLPRAIPLSRGAVRWFRAETVQWLQACQRKGRLIDRKEWEAMRAT